MNLQAHASDGTPEWARYRPEDWNPWQQVAAATHSIVTPGNGITAFGIVSTGASVLAFIHDRPLIGAIGAVVEGLSDLGDGAAAAATHTRCPLGKQLDAGSDQLRISSYAAVLAAKGFIPKKAAVALLVEKAAIVVPSAIAILKGNEPDVSSEGKITGGLQRATMLGFVGSSALQRWADRAAPARRETITRLSKQVRAGSYALLGASAISTVGASRKYIQAARLPKRAGPDLIS